MTRVRPSVKHDTPSILALSKGEPLFTPDDVDVVEELLEDYFDDPEEYEYYFLTADGPGGVAGFACYGPTPLTHGTYDLYWICVASGQRRSGVGRQLLSAVEDAVRERGGLLLVIDTSGQQAFAGTRAFYERSGYEASSRVPDFYAPGDDLVKYYRILTNGKGPGSNGRSAETHGEAQAA